MKRLFGALIGLGLVLLPNVAMAENWQVVANNDESAVHVDLDSVRFVKGYRYYTFAVEVRKTSVNRGTALIDCKTYNQVLSGLFLEGGGFRANEKPKVQHLAPNTLGRDAAEKVCAL
jgi:hypothetical protein